MLNVAKLRHRKATEVGQTYIGLCNASYRKMPTYSQFNIFSVREVLPLLGVILNSNFLEYLLALWRQTLFCLIDVGLTKITQTFTFFIETWNNLFPPAKTCHRQLNTLLYIGLQVIFNILFEKHVNFLFDIIFAL